MISDVHFHPNLIWVISSFKIYNKMEEVDESLMIANIEISCWKEQFKASGKSIPYTLINIHATLINLCWLLWLI